MTSSPIGSSGDRACPAQLMFVDLDGTLTPTDTLFESVVALIRRRPTIFFRIPGWLLRGKAHFKGRIAELIDLDAAALPYEPDLVADLRRWDSAGCELVLATAAPQSWANQVAAHLAMFDAVIASTATENLRGGKKLAAIVEYANGRAFGYVGNDGADLPILRAAEVFLLVGPKATSLRRRLRRVPVHEYGDSGGRAAALVRLIRVNHWPKNLLVFVPLLTSHRVLEGSSVGAASLAFLAFCLASSGGYALNDILDVRADRSHPEKSKRPLASGAVSMSTALWFGPTLFALAGVAAFFLPQGFQVAIASYSVLALTYSVVLKTALLLDVVTLATLFVIRLIAGAAAIEVPASFWLLAFSLFFFTSLALSKRCAELFNVERDPGRTAVASRAYRATDLQTLQALGIGAGLMSVLVVALYIQDPVIQGFYSRPQVLWLLAPLVLYWISRVWILVDRGDLNEDPLLFSLHDLPSQITVIAMLALTWRAL